MKMLKYRKYDNSGNASLHDLGNATRIDVFTGVNDIRGRPIYTNDIISFKMNGVDLMGVVGFNDKTASFTFGGYSLADTFRYMGNKEISNIEVVGINHEI